MEYQKKKFLPKDRFYNPSKRPKVRSLYYDWVLIYKRFYAKYCNIFAIVFMTLLIPFDFILFGINQHFTYFRLFLIFLYFFNIKFLFRFFSKNFIKSYLLLMPPLSFNLIYIYFLTFYQYESFEFNIVLLANFLIIFGTSIFINRFWKEQYFLNLGMSFLLGIFCFVYPEQKVNFILFIITHLSSGIICFFMRREFAGTMYEKFEMLTMFLPYQVAKYLGITGDTQNLEKVFRPRDRFVVCLCSDWRNYQTLAGEIDSKKLNKLIESYYDIAFDELESQFPEGNYFADWTADELFIIFYSNETKNDENLQQKVLKFSKILGRDVPMKIWNYWEMHLEFDIGIKSGVDLVGLQGPRKIKKTTVLGKTPGLAKRYETEAKIYRKEHSDESIYPIIVVDESMKNFALDKNIFFENEIFKIFASSKDIEDEVCYAWRFND